MPRLITIAIMAGCTGSSPEPTDTPAPWVPVTEAPGASLSAAWGASDDDVWVVGGDDTGGKLFHTDGASWDAVEGPAVGMLSWIHGFAADDVWATGADGAVLHYDGATWTAQDPGTTDDLWGVWGASPDELWFVGGAISGEAPTIVHHDGETFTPETLDPTANPKAATSLFKVWGADGRTFAVGSNGLIVEHTEAGWVAHSAGPDADQDFIALHGRDAASVVVVGGRDSPRYATTDGAAWTTHKPPPADVRPLSAVYAYDDDAVLVGGLYGFLGTLTPSTGAVEAFEPATDINLHAAWCGDTACYAVGGMFVAPHRGAVLRWEKP